MIYTSVTKGRKEGREGRGRKGQQEGGDEKGKVEREGREKEM